LNPTHLLTVSVVGTGYWLVDESGRKLIYVRPNATGPYADAWKVFIGATTDPTSVNQTANPPRGRGETARHRAVNSSTGA